MLDWSPTEFSRACSTPTTGRARQDRTTSHRPVPDEPGRARGAQLLIDPDRGPKRGHLFVRAAMGSAWPLGAIAQAALRCARLSPGRPGPGATAGDKATATTGPAGPAHIQAWLSLDRGSAQQRPRLHRRRTEVGWLPVLIRQSGQRAIQPGKPGNFEAAAVRAQSSRSRTGSTALTATCTPPATRTSRPTCATSCSSPSRSPSGWPNSTRPTRRHPAHAGRTSRRAGRRRSRAGKRGAPLRGVPIVVQHKAFPYLDNGWAGAGSGARACRGIADEHPPERVLAGLQARRRR